MNSSRIDRAASFISTSTFTLTRSCNISLITLNLNVCRTVGRFRLFVGCCRFSLGDSSLPRLSQLSLQRQQQQNLQQFQQLRAPSSHSSRVGFTLNTSTLKCKSLQFDPTPTHHCKWPHPALAHTETYRLFPLTLLSTCSYVLCVWFDHRLSNFIQFI